MANIQKVSLKKFAICIGMYAFMVICGSDCHPVTRSVTGSVTQSNVSHFEFFERIANPCEIAPSTGAIRQVPSTTASPSVSQQTRLNFYEAMATQLKITLRKVQILESNDPSLPECNGISLDSLPGTPMMDHFNEAETLKQSYQTGIYLTTHFHLMSLDRQITITGDNNVADENLQREDTLPTWRFLRCGNESESLPRILQDVTGSMENVLCTIQSGSSEEQRALFREPFNRLRNTVLYRYHTSCSFLQTRDCLVVREAKQALNLILRKFSKLISETALGTGADSQIQDDNMMENSL